MYFLKKHFALLITLLVFLVYLITLAPSVVEIDSGELATVQATLGIAHPTGYPLFTIAGYLFSKIPLPVTKIFQLNILAAIWCSLAVGLFSLIVKLILDNLSTFSVNNNFNMEKKTRKISSSGLSINKRNKEIPETKKYLTAVLSALILAFDKTYWLQSTSVEVYSLQAFLFLLIIFFVLKAYIQKTLPFPVSIKNYWMTVAAALALGFSNHMTTLFLLPGVGYLYFDKNGFNKKSYFQIGIMLLIFFSIIILFYSYLPIRAAHKPILNWGNPITFSKLLNLVEGKQYRVWFFSSAEAATKQFEYFLINLPSEFWVNIVLSAIGIFTSFIRARKLFFFIAITLLFSVFFAVNYNIHDINSYFLLAYISLTLFALFGIVQIFSFLKAKKHNYFVPAGLVILFIIVEAVLNFKEVNQNDNYTFNDYTKNILEFSNNNSLIITYEWDFFVSPSYYFQYVEHYRTDVIIVDKELLRRSWYYNQLNNDHPKLFEGLQDYVNSFLNAVAPFEKDQKYDSQILEKCYRNVLTQIVANNISKRDVYIAPELFDIEMQKGELVLPSGYTLVPELFNFKVVKGNNYVAAPDPNFTIRFPEKGNYYIDFIKNTVGSMLARRALYEMQFDKIDRAKLYIKKIKTDFPDYFLPAGLVQVLER